MKTDFRILQGIGWLVWAPIICRLDLQFREPLDRTLLHAALTEVVGQSDWFHQSLYRQGDKYCLRDNPNPVPLYEGDALRAIPQETNGHLFYFSATEDTLILTWDHFITDGCGGRRLLNAVAMAYCNLKYHAHFTVKPLTPVLPPEVLPGRPETLADAVPASLPKSGLEPRALLRVDKNRWIARALEREVKPFALLTFLTGKAVGIVKGKTEVSCPYAVDLREKLRQPDFLCNMAFTRSFNLRLTDSDASQLRAADEAIRKALEKSEEEWRSFYEKTMQKVDYLYRLHLSPEEKSSCFYQLFYADGYDCLLTYVGSIWEKDAADLERYVSGGRAYLYPHQGLGSDSPTADQIAVAAISTSQWLNLNLYALDRTEILADTFRKLLEDEQIPVTVELFTD